MSGHRVLVLMLCNLLLSKGHRPPLSKDNLERMREVLKPAVAEKISEILRLSFHDCIGGCDGCINLKNPMNRGLEGPLMALESIYQSNRFFEFMTRADFWALAGIMAIEAGAQNNNKTYSREPVPVPNLVFKYGREDCEQSPYSNRKNFILDTNHDTKSTLDFYDEMFDLTPAEAVAIQGAHSVSKASTPNSGHEGIWVEDQENVLNNRYYQILVDTDTWEQIANTPDNKRSPHWQWNAHGVGFMLHTDMSMYKDIELDEQGKSLCDYRTCPFASSARYVRKFAACNLLWMEIFSQAFDKVISTSKCGNYKLLPPV